MKEQAYNPYLPSYEYIPDGEPYVFGDRVYIYGSHDRFNGKKFCELNYICWSAPIDNLKNWRCEGEIYDKKKDPFGREGERSLYAPDVARGKDGKYYLFYAFDFLGVMSVAVCDTPGGTYEFYGHVHYPDGTLLGRRYGDAFQFDPGVLVDEDERVYLYSGFCTKHGPWDFINMPTPLMKGGMVIELETDMLTVKKDPEYIFPWVGNSGGTSFEGHEFFEASSIRKVESKYYFVFSSINSHELCYAISDYPDKDFVYGGTIISNGDIYFEERTEKDALNYYGNNHGSIVKINGRWFVFYHRHTNLNQCSRQACAEEIMIEVDGSIHQVEMTSCGLNDGPLFGVGKYEARIACNLMSGEGALNYYFGNEVPDFHPYFTQDGEDGDEKSVQYIANMKDGSCAGFKYFYFQNGKDISVTFRGNGTGVMWVGTTLRTHNVAEINISPSEVWKVSSAEMMIPDGKQTLYFTYKGVGAIDFLAIELG
jgi:hypothetical protein